MSIDPERLSTIRASGHFPEEAIAQFARFLETAPEEELFRINPLAYADRNGLSSRQAIDLFLHATRAGFLDFTWGVLCTGCYAFITTAPGLKSLQGQRECKTCRRTFHPDDANVEVTFTVSSHARRIRFHDPERLELRRDMFRVFYSPSLVAPKALERAIGEVTVDLRLVRPGAHTISAEFPAGEYVIVIPSHHTGVDVELAPDAESSEARVDLIEGQCLPKKVRLRPGRIRLELRNLTESPAVSAMSQRLTQGCHAFEVMQECRLRPYLTGKMLVTAQAFRELFRAESIPGDGGLEFKSLTVLFTDLKGSTELYERIGDFRAYGLVREHFDLLKRIIADQGGALVKTIGDAVMASFSEPLSALVAATAMNREIARLEREGEKLELKIGLHAGPCIAVESNERLDYFGQTVNIAARVQGAAAASEIVCTEPIYSAPGAADVIAAATLKATRDRAHLKGVDGDVTVYRLR